MGKIRIIIIGCTILNLYGCVSVNCIQTLSGKHEISNIVDRTYKTFIGIPYLLSIEGSSSHGLQINKINDVIVDGNISRNNTGSTSGTSEGAISTGTADGFNNRTL